MGFSFMKMCPVSGCVGFYTDRAGEGGGSSVRTAPQTQQQQQQLRPCVGIVQVVMSTPPFVKACSPAPSMPTNITVVTASFIKSFPFLSCSKKSHPLPFHPSPPTPPPPPPPAISVIDPQQLFCLLTLRLYSLISLSLALSFCVYLNL